VCCLTDDSRTRGRARGDDEPEAAPRRDHRRSQRIRRTPDPGPDDHPHGPPPVPPRRGHRRRRRDHALPDRRHLTACRRCATRPRHWCWSTSSTSSPEPTATPRSKPSVTASTSAIRASSSSARSHARTRSHPDLRPGRGRGRRSSPNPGEATAVSTETIQPELPIRELLRQAYAEAASRQAGEDGASEEPMPHRHAQSVTATGAAAPIPDAVMDFVEDLPPGVYRVKGTVLVGRGVPSGAASVCRRWARTSTSPRRAGPLPRRLHPDGAAGNGDRQDAARTRQCPRRHR
jgi:hypothetical protein